MIKRILIVLTIISLISAAIWDSYGKWFLIIGIGLLVTVLMISFMGGCGTKTGDWLLGGD